MDELIDFFFRMKWPDGFRCPRCGHPHAYTIRGRSLPLYQCLACRHQTSLRAGTALERSRTPLSKWAAAIRAISQLHGINAIQLMHEIQVTYKTAWSMLRKLRQSIHDMDEREPLAGRVEAGVAYYAAKHLRCFIVHPRRYPVIVGMAYNNNDDLAYTKMKPVESEHLTDFGLLRSGEEAFRKKHVQSGNPVAILKHIPFSKRPDLPYMFRQAVHWLHRVFHGVSRKYLGFYLAEFCFRLNMLVQNRDPYAVAAACSMKSTAIRSMPAVLPYAA